MLLLWLSYSRRLLALIFESEFLISTNRSKSCLLSPVVGSSAHTGSLGLVHNFPARTFVLHISVDHCNLPTNDTWAVAAQPVMAEHLYAVETDAYGHTTHSRLAFSTLTRKC